MCDLSASERNAILLDIAGLRELMIRVGDSAQTIRDRNWMNHDELDELFGELTEKAAAARIWVNRKVAAAHS
jgi:hypothetical protein